MSQDSAWSLLGAETLVPPWPPAQASGQKPPPTPPLQAIGSSKSKALKGSELRLRNTARGRLPAAAYSPQDPRGTCFALIGPRQYLEVGKPQGASIHAGGAFVCFLMSNETGSGKACASNLCPWRSLRVHTHPPAPQRELSAPPTPCRSGCLFALPTGRGAQLWEAEAPDQRRTAASGELGPEPAAHGAGSCAHRAGV